MRLLLALAASCFLALLTACNRTETPQPTSQVVAAEPDVLPVADQESASLSIFEKRILPIFQSQKPSSCAECHLSGVDLKDYIQADQQKTLGSLVNAGLIDVKKPLDSKILEFIQRKPEKPNLITDMVRQQEYEAFRAWIMAAVDDPKLLAAESDQPIGPQVPDGGS